MINATIVFKVKQNYFKIVDKVNKEYNEEQIYSRNRNSTYCITDNYTRYLLTTFICNFEERKRTQVIIIIMIDYLF